MCENDNFIQVIIIVWKSECLFKNKHVIRNSIFFCIKKHQTLFNLYIQSRSLRIPKTYTHKLHSLCSKICNIVYEMTDENTFFSSRRRIESNHGRFGNSLPPNHLMCSRRRICNVSNCMLFVLSNVVRTMCVIHTLYSNVVRTMFVIHTVCVCCVSRDVSYAKCVYYIIIIKFTKYQINTMY